MTTPTHRTTTFDALATSARDTAPRSLRRVASRLSIRRAARSRRGWDAARLNRVLIVLLAIVVGLMIAGEIRAHNLQLVSADEFELAWYSDAPESSSFEILLTPIPRSGGLPEEIIVALPSAFPYCYRDEGFGELLMELGVIKARVRIREVTSSGVVSDFSEPLYVEEPEVGVLVVAGIMGIALASIRIRRKRPIEPTTTALQIDWDALDEKGAPDPWQILDPGNPVRPARGIVYGLMISLILWAILIGIGAIIYAAARPDHVISLL